VTAKLAHLIKPPPRSRIKPVIDHRRRDGAPAIFNIGRDIPRQAANLTSAIG
jgi:hypothetical protein